MNILFLEPYYTGSHKSWIDGIKEHSNHEISVLGMAGRFWKWRMHGGCVHIAEKFNKLEQKPDLIIASDMIDLSGFLALTRKKLSSIPVAIYFHENQLTYPWSPNDRDKKNNRDRHYCFKNYISALSADYVFFNSEFHMKSFIGALTPFLKQFPDYNELGSIKEIEKKSEVLPLGIDLRKLDNCNKSEEKENKVPTLLWNHRWEYDKNPLAFFDIMLKLDSNNIDFQLIMLGERFGKMPENFRAAVDKLEHRIIKLGYAETMEEYGEWLWQADILPVTSIQDFFGISIMEALYCKCIPVLPVRLTYPHLVPIEKFNNFFYKNDDELYEKVFDIINNYKSIDKNLFREVASQYDWGKMIIEYDKKF